MPTILVVDDELAICAFLEDALHEEGHEVLLANHGQKALEILTTMRVDLMICDVMMPIMNGRTLVATVRATPHLRMLPVIMMSAARDETDLAETLNITFMAKPFPLPVLLDVIGRVLIRHA